MGRAKGGGTIPYARNELDGSRVYFEDDGGSGAAVVLHGGILDSVELVRASNIAQALRRLPEDEFRLIYVDHRGLGRSDKPHEVEAYTMPLRVADAVAVLDELGIERAHFIGISYGARLGFGIGEHAPERVQSLVLGASSRTLSIPTARSLALSQRVWPIREGQVLWSRSSRRWSRSRVSGSRRFSGHCTSTTTPQPSRRPRARWWLRVRSPKTLEHGK